MKTFVTVFALVCVIQAEEIRLLDLEPTDAQQYIDKQDTTLKYAPKIESNVPAVRFLGNEPHNVVEDIYLANQYHGQDGLGGYLYGYSVPDIAKTEKKKAGGDLRGAYNYISGDGQEIKVEYWDDGSGFHQIDNVPKIQPQQIDDTPEVKAAKEEHLRIWQEQAERNSKPIANPYDGAGNYAQGPLSVQGQQQYKQSQQFQQPQYNQAATQQYQQPKQQYQQPQFNQATQQYQQPQNQQYQQSQFKQPQQQTSALVNQYQQQKQHFPNPGQSVHYQGTQAGQYYQGQQSQTVNQYQAQATSGIAQPKQVYLPQQNPNQHQAQATQQNYAQAGAVSQPKQVYLPQQSQYQAQATNTQQSQTVQHYQGQSQSGEDDGQYRAGPDEEQGPPKGFFYNFDYPVGIIVSKEGGIQKRGSDLKDVYSTNKANFEKQLQGQVGPRPARSSTGYLYIPH